MNNNLVIASSRHQFEKALVLRELLSGNCEIWYLGNMRSHNNKVVAPDKFIFESRITQNDLTNFKSVFLFTLHANKKNFKLITMFRSLDVKIIGVQESHQLSLQNSKIFNFIFSPDILITASEVERKLIIENRLFPKERLLSLGWIFKSQITTTETFGKKGMIIFLGASADITPCSYENIYVWESIIAKLKKKHSCDDITIKPHPLDKRNIKKLLKINQYNNIKVLEEDLNPQVISKKYEYIYTSDKSQVFIDLYLLSEGFSVYSVKKPNIFFEKIKSKAINLGESIAIKNLLNNTNPELINEHELIGNNSKIHNIEINDMLLAIEESQDQLFEESSWNSIFGTNKSKPLFDKNELETNLIEELNKSICASHKGFLFINFIAFVISSKNQNQAINKLFIERLYDSIFIINFPYDSLRYFIYCNKYLPKIEFEEEIQRILQNRIQSFLKRVFLYKLINPKQLVEIIKKNFIAYKILDVFLKLRSVYH